MLEYIKNSLDTFLSSGQHDRKAERPSRKSAIEGLNADADDYLVKPFSARELLSGAPPTYTVRIDLLDKLVR